MAHLMTGLQREPRLQTAESTNLNKDDEVDV